MKRAKDWGVSAYEGVRGKAIQLNGQRVKAVETDQGTIETPVAVNAAGGWGLSSWSLRAGFFDYPNGQADMTSLPMDMTLLSQPELTFDVAYKRTVPTIRDSLITDGSEIAAGAIVERSVLSPGVYVGPKAVVRDCVILTDTAIEGGAVVERCVIDKLVNIGHNARVGKILEGTNDLGLTTIGKNSDIPAECVIGRNVIIGTDTKREHILAKYPSGPIPDGARINYTGPDQ